MRDFISNCRKVLLKVRSPRLRESKAHYASEALTCVRDLYWKATGEPETNPIDIIGATKMSLGKAIEEAFVKRQLIDNMSWYGTRAIGYEVSVGQYEPVHWHGYIDALMATQKTDSAGWDKWVLEIKTKYGKGADFMYSMWNKGPSEDYLAQLGLYLKHCSDEGLTNEGSLHYTLLGDAHFGDMVQYHCSFDNKRLEIKVFEVTTPDNEIKPLKVTFKIGTVFERWKRLEEAVAKKECPAKGDYQYKWKLTPELLKTLTDSQLYKGAKGEAVLGDWQPVYSRYKDKQLKTDNILPERTQEEIKALAQEYIRRKPGQRTFNSDGTLRKKKE